MCKATAKLELLEYGLHIAASEIDDWKFREKPREDETVEEFEKRLEQKVQTELRKESSSRRGDYKDGPVYQARKKVIDAFIKIAQGSHKRCSRPKCGA